MQKLGNPWVHGQFNPGTAFFHPEFDPLGIEVDGFPFEIADITQTNAQVSADND